ncbi:MAG: GNAT family N-acetyltransferase [Luteimonas sp.]
MNVLSTSRLDLRRLTSADAPFIFGLVNEPSWLRHIGDKGVRDLDGARRYIADGPMKMYAERGFGLYLVVRKEDGAPLGLCGLIKRDALEDVDIGFAFSPAYWGRGYAREAAQATLEHAHDAFGLSRLAAIVSPDNVDSIKLLEAIGFGFEDRLRMPGEKRDVFLYIRSTAE